jgi:hypothetical protein
LVSKFINQIFGNEVLSDSQIELIIIRRVMMIVFSHRHSKQDKFVLEIEQEKKEDT